MSASFVLGETNRSSKRRAVPSTCQDQSGSRFAALAGFWHGDRVLIYKILRPSEWDDFEASGRFDGSPDDRRDGFIHCSTREQAPATAQRFFASEPRLVVAVIDADELGDAVRWEEASHGGLFPHIYGPLSIQCVSATYSIDGASAVDAVLPSE